MQPLLPMRMPLSNQRSYSLLYFTKSNDRLVLILRGITIDSVLFRFYWHGLGRSTPLQPRLPQWVRGACPPTGGWLVQTRPDLSLDGLWHFAWLIVYSVYLIKCSRHVLDATSFFPWMYHGCSSYVTNCGLYYFCPLLTFVVLCDLH